MEEIYPAFAEEIYKIEKEIFKSDSTYEKNEALRNAVHSAVVLVSKSAIEEYEEKCVNLNGFEAIKKIADLYQINLFHGFPILFNMDDDKERNFSIMLSKAVDEAYRDPYNVEEELGRQIEVLQSNYTQSWYYVIDFKSATGFCFYTISRVTGASDKKAKFGSYKEAKIFFDKMKFFGWEEARNNYYRLCNEWEKMEDNAEV
mgnify:CR=1 FL=1